MQNSGICYDQFGSCNILAAQVQEGVFPTPERNAVISQHLVKEVVNIAASLIDLIDTDTLCTFARPAAAFAKTPYPTAVAVLGLGMTGTSVLATLNSFLQTGAVGAPMNIPFVIDVAKPSWSATGPFGASSVFAPPPKWLRADESDKFSSDILKAIKRLRNFRDWEHNWDGEGAEAPDHSLLNSAELLVGFLASFRSRLRVALDAFGRPIIFMSDGPSEAEITVTEADMIEFAIAAPAFDDAEAGLSFNGQRLPVQLRASLSRAGFKPT